MLFISTSPTFLFPFAVQCSVTIIAALETLGDIQLGGIAFRWKEKVIDVNSSVDASVGGMCVFSEYNNQLME